MEMWRSLHRNAINLKRIFSHTHMRTRTQTHTHTPPHTHTPHNTQTPHHTHTDTPHTHTTNTHTTHRHTDHTTHTHTHQTHTPPRTHARTHTHTTPHTVCITKGTSSFWRQCHKTLTSWILTLDWLLSFLHVCCVFVCDCEIRLS